MDPDHPVVRLCLEGMRAEGEGKYETALALFEQAWQAAQDDYYACVAAHFLARQQTDPHEQLRWNQEALSRAQAAGEARVRNFYPSLYLNLGYAHEVLGDRAEAGRCYARAAEFAGGMPAGKYGDLVRTGIANGQARVRY